MEIDSRPIDFRSDNVGGVSPSIVAAISAANTGAAASYGDDAWSRRLDERFGALFETDVKVFPVSTGTAANALCLSALTPPYGAIYCHEAAHIQTSEAGAVEFFSGGAKLTRAVLDTVPNSQTVSSFSALTRENYGLGLYLMGRYDEALVTLGAAHRDLLNTVGPNDQTTAESAEYLGLTQLRTGRIAEGLQSCQEAYNALLKHYGPDSQYTLMALGHRGIAELAAGSMSPGGKDLALAAGQVAGAKAPRRALPEALDKWFAKRR